jgi:glycosyltransferase involved in cell wall biosynthesis
MAATFHAQGPGRGTRPPTLWVDVEDLFEYARSFGRPSGIQRLAFEVQLALHRTDPAEQQVRFVRHGGADGFSVIPWAAVERVFRQLASAPAAPRRAAPPAAPAGRGVLLRLAYLLPVKLREPVGLMWRGVRIFARGAAGLVRESWGMAVRRLRPPQVAAELDAGDGAAFSADARAGDTLLALGAPWNDPHYAARIRAARTKLGLRYGVLLYDMIPLARPEWCYSGVVSDFRQWFTQVVPQADLLFAISRFTAEDAVRIAAREGVKLAGIPVALPLGTGFTQLAAPEADTPRPGLPQPGSYVLFVSTIEPRKNHQLMVRIWRRLLDEWPAERVPALVFAGRVGWMVDDLMQQLRNCDFLDGKVVLIENATDSEIAALYRGCLFTVFPSLYEGWGLPVTESLAMGKPCLCADRTSLPEAGGMLARYFDPEDGGAAFSAVVDMLSDPADLAQLQRTVRGTFTLVPWDEAAAAVMAAAVPLPSDDFDLREGKDHLAA